MAQEAVAIMLKSAVLVALLVADFVGEKIPREVLLF